MTEVKSKLRLFTSLTIIPFVMTCSEISQRKDTGIDVEIPVGHWYFSLYDSNYREIFFTDTISISYDEAVGFIYVNLKKELDSIAFYQDGFLVSRYKPSFESRDTVVLSAGGSSPSMKLVRVSNSKYSDLWIKNLVEGRDEEIEKLRFDFDEREYERRRLLH